MQINDFVIVKFQTTKNNLRYYVGLVQGVGTQNEFIVKFLRKSGATFYIFPENDDVSAVDKKDIVHKLCQPNVNNRGQYIFSEDIPYKKCMF